eukprot:TCALIF_05465-PA protein Name:"Similar to Ppn Papilin (Drosophila melanogaster)" AED:0.16 eAED:0.17 QI:0/0/0/0.82/0.81/0.82/34/0/2463
MDVRLNRTSIDINTEAYLASFHSGQIPRFWTRVTMPGQRLSWLGRFALWTLMSEARITLSDPNKHALTPEELFELAQIQAHGYHPHQAVFVPRIRSRRQEQPTPYVYISEEEQESGPWNEWSQSADCSRTCGGGVLTEGRSCMNPNPSECFGPSKRYSSCNTQPCPRGSRDFREEQCSNFNNVAFEGKMYQWIPYLKAPRKCELNCMPKGERFYYRHAKTVIITVVDGTSCDIGDGSPRICVAGECLKVGCDGVLNGNQVEDKCRVCGGDGTDCNTVIGTLDEEVTIHVLKRKELVMGYNDLLLIPVGATNIKIVEAKASNNYLAIRNMSGHYFINGNWRVDFPGDYEVAGTTFKYEKKPKGKASTGRTAKLLSLFAPEHMSALGPIQEPLYVVLLSQEKNPGIEFEYSLPSGAVAETPPEGDGYEWSSGEWDECDVPCGGGNRGRQVFCAQMSSVERVPDYLCEAALKPPTNEICNTEACRPTWKTGPWSDCEGSSNGTTSDDQEEGSGEGAESANSDASCPLLQVRNVYCAQVAGKGISAVIDESLCEAGEKPVAQKSCNEDLDETATESDGPKFHAGPWSGCSALCGEGVRKRAVTCFKIENGTKAVLEDSDCSTSKPEEEEPCLSKETRVAFCSDANGMIGNDTECDSDKLPPLDQDCAENVEPCEGTDECTGTWLASQWGPCSKDCGGGQKRRKVFCIKDDEPVAPDQCPSDLKPFEEDDCNKDDCEEASGDGESPEEEGAEDLAEDECKEYYADEWIFGEGSPLGPKGNSTEADEEAEGSGEEDPDAITAEDLAGFKKRCKPEAIEPCANSTYKCCPDNFHAAQGPFGEGCEEVKTCEDSRFGCCHDGATPAEGNAFEGCPPSQCDLTLFGCCSDGETRASGPDGEGCDENKLCENGPFGCCPDARTFAQGPKNQGCFECPEEVWMCDSCEKTEFGCCTDMENAALGPSFEGCPSKNGTDGGYKDCTLTEHGCCPDGLTKAKGPNFKGCEDATPCKASLWGCCDDLLNPAHGPNKEGCCLTTKFGCCEDNVSPAEGPNQEGCGCEFTEFKCCPDDFTAARGPDFAGCGCQITDHGCCPDQFSPAEGPNFEGCPCHTYEYGCCPDGISIARGPGQEGCTCKDTEFGCCEDRRTPADGPDAEGCGCVASKFGCCPDGEQNAEGENFEACNSTLPIPTADVCSMPKDRGTDRNFTVRWFFDMEYGGCSRFWYGGGSDDGNGNNFESKDLCNEVCVEPEGKEACPLPRVPGPCEGYYPRFGYDADSKTCQQFIYGGCLGNKNKYETKEECEATCAEDGELTKFLTDKCQQPIKEGPCAGNFTRWGYNQEIEECEEFTFGGCKGNMNAFLTQEECVNSCQETGTSRDACLLPRSPGPCKDNQPKWYFDNFEKRCMPFYYGGCEGNGNRFDTLDDCQKSCPAEFLSADVCQLPEEAGPCRDYLERYFFDAVDGTCKLFYFGGCEGNKNNFKTMDECQSRCSVDFSIPIEEEFKSEFCFLAKEAGIGDQAQKRWFYDSSQGICEQFDYKGKKGNGNRFLTRQACEMSCQPSQDVCELPKIVGPCGGREEQFWYDKEKDDCFTFDWGGCQGNRNRFASRQFCEAACKRTCDDKVPNWYFTGQEGQCAAFTYSGCEGNANRFTTEEQCDRQCGRFKNQDVCSMPKDIGPCLGRFKKWFYDANVRKCKEFAFGGCEGNGNRFSSQEECETICVVLDELLVGWVLDTLTWVEGEIRRSLQDGNNTDISKKTICNQEMDTGPCEDSLKRWFYSPERGTCMPFIYTGCAGNMNRFKSYDVCMGFCEAARQDFSPLGPGNKPPPGVNGAEVYAPPPPPDLRPEPQPELNPRPDQVPENIEYPYNGYQLTEDIEDQPRPAKAPVDSEQCRHAEERCAYAQCEYGVIRYLDDRSGCEACQCNEPCLGHECPEGTKCSVDLYYEQDGSTGYSLKDYHKDSDSPGKKLSMSEIGINFRAVCRDETKDGVCPKLNRNDYASCSEDCAGDSDCGGDQKCCYNGCGKSCLDVVKDPGSEYLPAAGDGQAPVVSQDPDAPKIEAIRPWNRGWCSISGARDRNWIDIKEASLNLNGICLKSNGVSQPTVVANEGSLAELSVYVIGNPNPDVYWRKGRRDIDTTQGKFRIVKGGSLQIVGVDPSDEGVYTCLADNGRGIPAEATVTLAVDSPVDLMARVIPTEPEVYLSLGVPAILHCLAYGHPRPSVTWWRQDEMMPLSSNRHEQNADFSLRLKAVGLRDLGPYTCQAFNGQQPDSFTVVVKAVGLVNPTTREEQDYMQYVVDAPQAPAPVVTAPSAIYRPTRPPGWNFQAPPTTTTQANRPEMGYLDVRIDLPRSKFPLMTTISIPCTVNSYAQPTVFWNKDGRRLRSDKRVQIIRTNNTLTIYDSTPEDTGTYTCEASNGYSSNSASVSVIVENVQVQETCTDNPYFANCKLIVKARYCANKYYAKFCCRSCTIAGQL